jgi:hypothetical protein
LSIEEIKTSPCYHHHPNKKKKMVRAHQQPDHAPLFSLAHESKIGLQFDRQQQKATKEENNNNSINKKFYRRKRIVWRGGQ